MFRGFVSLSGPSRVLASAQLIGRTGDGAYYVCASLFFTRVVGLSPFQMGLGLSVAWSLALASAVPLGYLTERWGARTMTAACFGGASLAVACYTLIRSFPLFVLAACLYAVCHRGSAAAAQALLAAVVPRERLTAVRAVISSIYSGGLALGAGLGGLALLADSSLSYTVALLLNSAGFFAAGLLVLRLPSTRGIPAAVSARVGRSVIRDRPYLAASLLNAVMLLHLPLIDVVLPLWIVRYTQAPVWVLAVMFAMQTAASVCFQVRLAKEVTDLVSAARAVLRGGLALGVCCPVFAASAVAGGAWSATVLLLVAAAVQSLGGMTQLAGAWEISFGLTPDGRHEQYQALFGAGGTLAELVGPVLLTGMLVYWGPPGWLVLGAVFVASGAAMGLVARRGHRAAVGIPEGSLPGTSA